MRNIVDQPGPEGPQPLALDHQRRYSPVKAMRLIVRQALLLCHQQQKHDHGQLFGLWRDRPEDSLALQHSLRQEWVEG